MGAGKTHVMDWLCERGVLPLMVPIDADLFKAALPEWAGYVSRDPLTAGFHTRRESGYLVELAQEASLRARQHVWVDGSLRDGEWYQQVFARIRARHPAYRIAILWSPTATPCTGGSPRAPRSRAATCRAPRSTTARACPSRSRQPRGRVPRRHRQLDRRAAAPLVAARPTTSPRRRPPRRRRRRRRVGAAARSFADGGAPPPPVAPTLPPPGPRREPLTSKL